MIRDEKPRPVAIFTRGSSGLYADDRGVTVDGPLRIRRFAWPDISHFADGIRGMDQGYAWVLNIVLRSGRTVPVPCTAGSPTPELLAAVRRLADVHGIPATLTGIMMKDGRPVDRGFYTDPGGRAGLRYWDGKRWSPLLRQKDGRGWSKGRQSAAFWAELPVAPEPWTYPAARVARSMAWIRVWALLTVALLVMGVAVGPAQYRGFTFSLFCISAVITALCLIPVWFSWRKWKTVKAASDAATADDGAYGLVTPALGEAPERAAERKGFPRWSQASPGQRVVIALVTVGAIGLIILLLSLQDPLCAGVC